MNSLAKLKSTLGKVTSAAAPMASKLSVVAKPALLLAKGAAMSNPYTATALVGGTVIMGALSLNKKNTLGAVSDKVEAVATGGVALVGKAGSSIVSGTQSMMMPFIIIAGLGCIFMFVLKR